MAFIPTTWKLDEDGFPIPADDDLHGDLVGYYRVLKYELDYFLELLRDHLESNAQYWESRCGLSPAQREDIAGLVRKAQQRNGTLE